MVSAYTNGSTTDLNTTNANNLTAQNGATTATSAPYGNDGVSSTLDYALVQAVSTTVATVQVPEGCTIPTSGGVTSVAYSVQGNPYGWVSDKGRWAAYLLVCTDTNHSSLGAGGYWNVGSVTLGVGSWDIVGSGSVQLEDNAASTGVVQVGLGTTASSFAGGMLSRRLYFASIGPTALGGVTPFSFADTVSLTAQTTYHMNGLTQTGNLTILYFYTTATVGDTTKVTFTPMGL
jgi:hypothetical protein